MSSGVSLLASKLSSSRSTSASMESVKLGDSITHLPLEPSAFKSQLELLIRQTDHQERELLKYHSELTSARELVDELRIRMIEKSQRVGEAKLVARAYFLWRRRCTRKPVKKAISASGVMIESVNLNETLRSLALQLESPKGDESMNMSSMSLNAPFTTRRSHIRRKC